MKSINYFTGFFVGILLLTRISAALAAESMASADSASHISYACAQKDIVAEHAGVITFEPLTASKDTYTLDSDVIFHKINDYRMRRGLPAFERNESICSVAKSREGQLEREIATGRIHAGFKALNLPYFATENMKFGFSEDDVVSWWLKSPIHHKAMVGSYKYSCGTCKGHVCIQLFTSHDPRQNVFSANAAL